MSVKWLVQLATLQWLRAQGVYEQWRYQFLVRLCAELPVGEYENWSKCQALFPHAQSVSTQRPATKESMKEWATILYKAAWYAIRTGKGMEAENLSVQAMKARKRILDSEHDDVIWSKAMVASAYSLSGRWIEAERLFVQVMETSKTKLGVDYPSTLTSMANLASTYMYQGRWEEAERLFVQARPRVDVAALHGLASLALRLGFESAKINEILADPSDWVIAKQALLSARKPEYFEYEHEDDLATQIASIFNKARPVAFKTRPLTCTMGVTDYLFARAGVQ